MTTATATGRTEAPASAIPFRIAIVLSLSPLGRSDDDIQDDELELGRNDGGKKRVQEHVRRHPDAQVPRISCGAS
jgi:hypothetical protein